MNSKNISNENQSSKTEKAESSRPSLEASIEVMDILNIYHKLSDEAKKMFADIMKRV